MLKTNTNNLSMMIWEIKTTEMNHDPEGDIIHRNMIPVLIRMIANDELLHMMKLLSRQQLSHLGINLHL